MGKMQILRPLLVKKCVGAVKIFKTLTIGKENQ